MSLINIINLPNLGDERGSLVSIETFKTINFEIKRVYYIYGANDGISRGFHAHKKLMQLAICVSGKCRFVLDDGTKNESVWLDNPSKGLLINCNTWREMHDFSDDCVLVVLASDYYDEADYIRDYDLFKKWVNQ